MVVGVAFVVGEEAMTEVFVPLFVPPMNVAKVMIVAVVLPVDPHLASSAWAMYTLGYLPCLLSHNTLQLAAGYFAVIN